MNTEEVERLLAEEFGHKCNYCKRYTVSADELISAIKRATVGVML